MSQENALIEVLERIAGALGVPAASSAPSLSKADAYHWQPESRSFREVPSVHALPLALLLGIDHAKEMLLANTQRFVSGLPANNALLWGARGTGKSSLVKAIHRHFNEQEAGSLALIEIAREDIQTLPALLQLIRPTKRRFILLCDDLSFDQQDTSYKSLKSVLDGGLEGRPENVLFYATSNRRHLMPRDMMENERATAVHPGETIEEKVSLSDRFGLWIGFHHLDQPTYLDIVHAYRDHFQLKITDKTLDAKALEWSITRGARSGRVAWQFITDLAGELGVPLALD